MLSNFDTPCLFQNAEHGNASSYQNSKSSSNSNQHISWVSQIIKRIISSSYQNTLPDSNIEGPHLLNLSFSKITSIPQYSKLSDFSKMPINLETLSNGMHYALIVSVLTNGAFEFDINRPVSSQFDIVFKSLASIGFKPRQPCTSFGLMSGIEEQHTNLCETLEFAIFENSLSIEKLLNDIRKLPRSFFVLHDGYYPTKIEEAISLWLSKFPCIDDLPEISYSDFSSLKEEISKGVHISAVMSRVYPRLISKKSIFERANFDVSMQILEEIGAFVPTSIQSLSYNLLMCFVSDLYYATRIGAKKFVRVERSPNAVLSCRRPKVAISGASTIEKVPKLVTTATGAATLATAPKMVTFCDITENGKVCSSKPIQNRPRTEQNVFRPSRRPKKPCSNSVSSSHHPRKNVGEGQKRPIKTAIPQKRPIMVISSNVNNGFHSARIVDDEADLMQLFTYMRRGERKDKFVDVDDPLIMVKPLCSLLKEERPSEQTFAKFWSFIENDSQSLNHYRNCFAFLNALGGNNNEFAASRRIVYFARQMLKSYTPEPVLQTKRVVQTSYQARRSSALKRIHTLQNQNFNINMNPSSGLASLIRVSKSDSVIQDKK